MLTRRGWSVLGAASGCYLGSRVLGLTQLAMVAAAGLVLVAGASAWVEVHPISLRAARHLRERLQVGVDGRVDVLVTTAGRRGTPTLAVTDSFDRGRRAARFLLPPLRPGGQARAAYRIPTERRGRFELGPLRASASDAFGIAEREASVLGSEEVIVYPRVHEILPLPDWGGDELDQELPRAHGRIDPSGDFLTLRDYAPGDDLRRVHWRSTARRDRLMVRQHEARRRAPMLLVLDVRPGAHDHASFERAVEACASIASATIRAGRPCEVVLSTGATIGAPGQRQLASVMDELAVVQPHGPDRLVVAATRRRTSSLVAVLGRARLADHAALGILVRDGGRYCTVLTRPAEHPAEIPAVTARRYRAATVASDSDHVFPAAWNHAVLAWQRRARRSTGSHAPA